MTVDGRWLLVIVVSAALPSASLPAQTLVSLSGAALAVSAPTEAQYDAGGPSSSTSTYTVTTTCTGSKASGCRLFLQFGSNSQGQQVDVQWAVTSLSSNQCRGATANPNAWFDVVPTAVVLSTRKNRTCTATFIFRVNPLSYSTYQSPGPSGGAYRQQVRFVFTRP